VIVVAEGTANERYCGKPDDKKSSQFIRAPTSEYAKRSPVRGGSSILAQTVRMTAQLASR
jgi:hypothetical protein